MTDKAMVLPRRLRKTWLTALRSGNYRQATKTLYDTHTKGFCCLGVLQHCAMKGHVEAEAMPDADGTQYPAVIPSKKFYSDYKITTTTDFIDILVDMNDVHYAGFEEIADYIEANSKGR